MNKLSTSTERSYPHLNLDSPVHHADALSMMRNEEVLTRHWDISHIELTLFFIHFPLTEGFT